MSAILLKGGPLATSVWYGGWGAGQAHAQQSPDYNLARRQYVDRIVFLLQQTFDARFVRAEEAEATILLRYAADGKLLEMVLEERSGDAGFDAALLSAIRRSVPRIPEAPVPPGPEGPFAMRIRFRGSS